MKQQDFSEIATILERLSRLLSNDANASGLLPVHWETLRYLSRANRFSLNTTALAAYLGSTKGTVSQTIKALERKGLVANKPEAKDRRRNRLSLTAEGLQLLDEDPIKEWEKITSELPVAMQSALSSGLKRLLSKRLDQRQRQPFGQCQDCLHFSANHADGMPHFCALLNEPLTETEASSICFEQTA